MKPTALGKILEETLERMEIKRGVREKLSLFVWADAVGPEIARHSRPVRAQRGVLTVETANPAWSQQLTLLKPGLLKAINERLGGKLIKDLRFQSGDGFTQAARPIVEERPGAELTPPGEPPSSADLVIIDEWASVIGDEALRERWRRVMVKARASLAAEARRQPGE